MKNPLHILHLEDDPLDVALVDSTLAADGIAHRTECVQGRGDFVAALEGGDIDLVLSDFALPAFDGLAALAIVRDRWPDLPVILVSGTLGEEQAILSLKSGATDYVMKERLSRLAPAVRRAMQDTDERVGHRAMEAQFIQAQKMEVVGQLASGVAHDFNNILMVIMGYNSMIADKLGPAHPLQPFIEEIRAASERAAGLTRQLLLFSRKQSVRPVVLNLNDTVQELEKILRRLVDENIELSILPGAGLGRIRADSGYLGQVLMNLVVNARDAMPQGGKLAIATDNVTLADSSEPASREAAPGDYVMLSVSDTGCGMSEEVKARLFEAFFTTKPLGKGTGLGLATCQTIVQQLGGHIAVHSEVDRGTTFKVFIPRILEPLEPVVAPAAVGPLPRGTETILVVEDEPSVRHLACGLLEGQGYTVVSASNGQDGLRAAQQHRGEPIRLVVTDVIMPLMSGIVMADWLKTRHPELKVLFTSGYADDAIARQGEKDASVALLPKPYTQVALAHKVREMLDRGGLPGGERSP